MSALSALDRWALRVLMGPIGISRLDRWILDQWGPDCWWFRAAIRWQLRRTTYRKRRYRLAHSRGE